MSSHRIIRNFDRPPQELLERVKGGPLGFAGPMTFSGRYVVDPKIKALRGDFKVFGPALTVTVSEPDLLMPMYALEFAQPGDVLVIDAGGRVDIGVWGFSMTLSAMNRGVSGVLIDGGVVDSAWIRGETEFSAEEEQRRGGLLPVFAREIVPSWAGWDKPGSINVPIRFGGLTVEPGDLVCGDVDGLVIIPRAKIEDAIPGREQMAAMGRELRWLDRLREGDTTWFHILPMRESLERLAVPEFDRAEQGS